MGVAVVGLTNNVHVVRLTSSSEELAVSHRSSNFTSTYCFRAKAWRPIPVVANECLRSHVVSGEILGSLCEGLRD